MIFFEGSTLTLAQTLWLLAPEIVLLATGLLLLALHALRSRQEQEQDQDQENERWPVYVALGGFVAALGAAVSLWGCNTQGLLAAFSCDPFALTSKIVALGGMGIVALMSDDYIRARRPRRQAEFYALLLFCSLPMCLMASATDLILIFLAFEFLNITSYILTGYLRDDVRSVEAAIKYFLYGSTLSVVMLFGVSWFYGLTGATDLRTIAAVLIDAENVLRPTLLPALIFVLVGLAYRVGAVPFHQWAPDAYEGAPTPVAAFLSVGPKVAGFTVILRLLLTALPVDLVLALDWRTLLIAISVLTMTLGNLVALWQDNIKRLLAYASIAQTGYILIGVVIASPRGVTAVLLYLITYVATNLGVFAAVIAFSNQTGSDEIEDYAGLGKRAPLLAMGLFICLLSLVGIPLTAGFVGKGYLFLAAIEEGLLWMLVIGAVNHVISLAYCWKVIRAMYLVPAQEEEPISTSPMLAVSLGITVAGVLFIGVFPGSFIALVQAAAPLFLGG